MAVPDVPEFAELEAYRLEHDLSWPALAVDMAERVGVEISPRTLHYLCKRLPEDGHALDRTLYKIRKYLTHVRELETRARGRRRKVSA